MLNLQEDNLISMLTVRENIEFSAALRLPQNLTPADRQLCVDKVIRALELDKCANTKVGGTSST